MTITLTPDIEAAVAEQAHLRGISPETLALDTLREKFAAEVICQRVILREPRDEWERALRNTATDADISLTDEQLGREVMYEDRD